jgi:hypothetical protein
MIRLLLALFLIPIIGVSQIKNKPGMELPVSRAVDKIVLDGDLSEQTWKLAERGRDFYVSKPIDSIPATNQTFFQISFDDEFLYVAYECFDDEGAPIVTSLRRDFDFRPSDNVGIYLNTYNDFTNGFYFNITPYGVQREGVMFNAGTGDNDYSSFWDNKWYSGVKRYSDRWVAEIAIPFKSIRYNQQSWNFNVLRNDVSKNQVSSWIATPVQYLPAAFANSGKIIWQTEIPKPGMNISLIPYATGGGSKDIEKNSASKFSRDVGLDAKIGLTPSLNLDITINPDFSNVEVDRQVINLTRFEFNFPERRQFFLENNDLFSGPGYPDTRVFFSRRIGLATHTDSLGNTSLVQVPIQYGARVSGKLGKQWRLGVMNMQTEKVKKIGLPSQNYTVGVLQRQILKRSNIDVVVVNKQSLGLGSYDSTAYYHPSVLQEVTRAGDTTHVFNSYNRVIGSDFNFFTADNRWVGDVYYFKSFDEFRTGEDYSYGVFLNYRRRNLNAYIGNTGVGKNYKADVGFVPGLRIYPGFSNSFFRLETPFFPKHGKIVSQKPGVGYTFLFIPDGTVTDQNLTFDYVITWSNTSTFTVAFNHVFQKQVNDQTPIDKEKDKFLAGESYDWNDVSFLYNTDLRKLFNFTGGIRVGEFYNGNRANVNGSIAYRYQPFGSFTIDFDYNMIKLPGKYGEAKYLLISPRMDLTFTDKVFLTTFVQYNDRADNVNLNARFQWRFKPASDFFVVYTENYLPGPFKSKNRALVLKLTYWFNL